MENKKRKPIKRRVRNMVLLISTVSVLVTSITGLVSMMTIRNLAESIMVERMENNLISHVSDRCDTADAQFSTYAGYVEDFGTYLKRLYQNPDIFPKREILPPQAENADVFAAQRALADESVKLSSVEDELCLLGNVEDMFASVITDHQDVITTIYLTTESGIMIAYDKNSGSGVPEEGQTDSYFNFWETEWYQTVKSKQSVYFTDVYQDSYGRGLTITCAGPFYQADDSFAGVVCMDILISDLYQSMVAYDYGEGAYSFLVDQTGGLISPDPVEQSIYNDPTLDNHIVTKIMNGETGASVSQDGSVYYAYAPVENVQWKLCIKMPETLILQPIMEMDNHIRVAITFFICAFLLILVAVVILTARFADRLTRPLLALGGDVAKIAGGDLSYRARIYDNDEIGDLAVDFNNMAVSLSKYIEDLTSVTAEKERIGAELNVATQIQADMLPRIFPPFPERKEFDIYASMDPAKEVGGDFYDFFLIDDDHIALVVADVSGKGVPAALFMVIAKTLIKNRAMMGGGPAEILTYVNNQLCEGNEAELFVTVWLAIIEISTGKGLAANAGHEHPALRRKDGSFELIQYRHSPAVATMEGIRFREHEFELHPGDTLIEYSDGVSEATNRDNVLFGNDRLIEALNREPDAEPEKLLANLRKDIDIFVDTAPQFDDITMLGFKYYGRTEE